MQAHAQGIHHQNAVFSAKDYLKGTDIFNLKPWGLSRHAICLDLWACTTQVLHVDFQGGPESSKDVAEPRRPSRGGALALCLSQECSSYTSTNLSWKVGNQRLSSSGRTRDSDAMTRPTSHGGYSTPALIPTHLAPCTRPCSSGPNARCANSTTHPSIAQAASQFLGRGRQVNVSGDTTNQRHCPVWVDVGTEQEKWTCAERICRQGGGAQACVSTYRDVSGCVQALTRHG